MRITNEVIVERLDNLKEDVKGGFGKIDKHLEKLNTQTERNTKFRVAMSGTLKFLAWLIGSGGLVTVIILFVKSVV